VIMNLTDTWSFLLDFYPGVVKDLPVVAFGSDIFLAAKVVGVANSVFFNMTHTPCTSITAALERVGSSYALALLRNAKCVTDAQQLIHFEAFWLHSAATAAFAERVTSEVRAPQVGPDAMYWIALVHDIGMLVEMEYDRGQLATVVGVLPGEATNHARHCSLGHGLGVHWSFPSNAKDVIRWHHSPQEELEPPVQFALAVLRVAHAIAEGVSADDFIADAELASAYAQTGMAARQLDKLFSSRPAVIAQLHRSMLPVA
jgi:HD-like signal output (HDOD) protein